uniref:ZP domain-containing protein n=1 Tax=Astyanax mexicanus TaxID=7994 RepID=A0A3B1J238_ASTMX
VIFVYYFHFLSSAYTDPCAELECTGIGINRLSVPLYCLFHLSILSLLFQTPKKSVRAALAPCLCPANGTHFIYENTIQGGADSAKGSIHRKKYLELQFSCIYQISQTLSMDTELTPLLDNIAAGFLNVYSVVRKRLPVVDERIYVGVFVQGVDSRQIATVIDSCWATPENDQNHANKILFIFRCPNPEDTTVEVLQNGVSTTGRFSFRMFAFNGDYQKVFLHCSIHLCILKGNNCAAVSFIPFFHPDTSCHIDLQYKMFSNSSLSFLKKYFCFCIPTI